MPLLSRIAGRNDALRLAKGSGRLEGRRWLVRRVEPPRRTNPPAAPVVPALSISEGSILCSAFPNPGPDFIRALAKQQITIVKDFAQEVDAIGQGRYPVLIGTADFLAIALAKQGVPIAIVDLRQLKEGIDTSPVNGALALFNKAPHHPNAAKIYMNWLLSKKGQIVFCACQWLHQRSRGRAD